jgi:maltose O-acetyltransferase
MMRGAGRLLRTGERMRRWKFRQLSTCVPEGGTAIFHQPVLFLGPGCIVLGRDVMFGWPTSVGFHTGYGHVEASLESVIEIGDGAEINNDAFIKSEGPGIRIGSRAILGSQVCIYDSDFHELDPRYRRGGRPAMEAVEIGENAFVGDRVVILKGVVIGADSVIGAGSVVTRSVPAGMVAAGNPARVIKDLSGTWRRQDTRPAA